MPADQPPTLIQTLTIEEIQASKPFGSDAMITFGTAFSIYNDGKLIVSISSTDGTVTFGDGVEPDEAAKGFWEQITRMYPAICRKRVQEK
jgi:hypothetical protein